MTLTALQWETAFCELMSLRGYSSVFIGEKAAALLGLFDALAGLRPADISGEDARNTQHGVLRRASGPEEAALYAAALGFMSSAIGPSAVKCQQLLFSEKSLPLPERDRAAQKIASYKKTAAFLERETRRRQLFDACGQPDEALLEKQLRYVCDVYSCSLTDLKRCSGKLVRLPFIGAVREGSTAILRELAQVFGGGKSRNAMFFAVCFAASYAPAFYPVCDRFVSAALCYYRNEYGFYPFSDAQLADYDRFRKLLLLFRQKYGLTSLSSADVAIYLSCLGQSL